MRLSFDLRDSRQVAVVTLSRRNLLALLHKLEMSGSARTLESGDCPEGWVLVVRSEADAEHYSGRPFAPGPMHPRTERFIAAEQARPTSAESTSDTPDEGEQTPPSATDERHAPAQPVADEPPHPWPHWYDRDRPFRESVHGDVVINLQSPIEDILGPSGRMLGASKTYYRERHPDHECLFNACIFDRNREEVWFGDLDLTLDAEKLQQVADLVGEIWVTPEQPFRFEGLPKDLSELDPSDRDRVRSFRRRGSAASEQRGEAED